jgi:hypothetical protein
MRSTVVSVAAFAAGVLGQTGPGPAADGRYTLSAPGIKAQVGRHGPIELETEAD